VITDDVVKLSSTTSYDGSIVQAYEFNQSSL